MTTFPEHQYTTVATNLSDLSPDIIDCKLIPSAYVKELFNSRVSGSQHNGTFRESHDYMQARKSVGEEISGLGPRTTGLDGRTR